MQIKDVFGKRVKVIDKCCTGDKIKLLTEERKEQLILPGPTVKRKVDSRCGLWLPGALGTHL